MLIINIINYICLYCYKYINFYINNQDSKHLNSDHDDFGIQCSSCYRNLVEKHPENQKNVK